MNLVEKCSNCKAEFSRKKYSSRKLCKICRIKSQRGSHEYVQCVLCAKQIPKKRYVSANSLVFCDSSCSTAYRNNETLKRRTILFEKGELKYRSQIKPLLVERDNWCCQICGNTEWSGQPMPLQVDHIDGNAANNSPQNLRLICHNCDALLPTFAGRNRGYGRKSRGLKSYD